MRAEPESESEGCQSDARCHLSQHFLQHLANVRLVFALVHLFFSTTAVGRPTMD